MAYWVDANAFPEPTDRDGRNDEKYRRFVEGRTLDETTDTARRWLGDQVDRMNHESGYYG